MKSVVSLAFVLLIGVPAAGAQEHAADRARLDEIAREAARTFAAARAAAVAAPQTVPVAPPQPPGARIDLTLADAVQRALERNLDISVERLNPQTFDFAIA